MAGLPPEPEMAEPGGDLDVTAGPALALLPQPADGSRFLCPYDRMRLEDNPVSGQLGQEGGHGVLGERGRVDPAADHLEVGPGMQLGAARQAGDRAQHVLAAPGRRLRGDVLVADEPGHEVPRPGALLDVTRYRADIGI